MNNIIGGCLILLCTGCVSVSDVIPVGKDKYTVSSEMVMNFPSWSEVKQLSLKHANKYCNGKGQYMEVVGWNLHGARGFTPLNAELIFLCLTEPAAVPENPENPERIKSNNKDTVIGSCVVVDDKGTILTAYHVIQNIKEPLVHFMNGQHAKFSPIHIDPANDLAVLKSELPTKAYVSIAPQRSLVLGQHVFTIGFPVASILGQTPKFTEGSVSSLSGPKGMANLFQISIPLQPGNSGGPVVNEKGELVGIVSSTAKISSFLNETGSLPQNVNWAIKAEYASLLFEPISSLSPTPTWQEAIERAKNAICYISESGH
jgi:S1-C subfamily serine protease